MRWGRFVAGLLLVVIPNLRLPVIAMDSPSPSGRPWTPTLHTHSALTVSARYARAPLLLPLVVIASPYRVAIPKWEKMERRRKAVR